MASFAFIAPFIDLTADRGVIGRRLRESLRAWPMALLFGVLAYALASVTGGGHERSLREGAWVGAVAAFVAALTLTFVQRMVTTVRGGLSAGSRALGLTLIMLALALALGFRHLNHRWAIFGCFAAAAIIVYALLASRYLRPRRARYDERPITEQADALKRRGVT